jgi:putative endonuclease
MGGLMGKYYVYILANRRNGTLYVGMTNNLVKRADRHSRGKGSKFVRRYKLNSLVYYESVYGYLEVRKRERELKWWERKCKLELIEGRNPDWKDLSKEIAT